jgi:hypothetical protein
VEGRRGLVVVSEKISIGITHHDKDHYIIIRDG